MNRMQSTLRSLAIVVAGLVLLIVLAGVALIASDGPQGRLVMSAGGADGNYVALARSYTADLKRNGVVLSVRDDLTGPALLQALAEPTSGVDAGILKGGYFGSLTGRFANAADRDEHARMLARTRSIGRVMLEPIWVFTRGDLPIASLRDLAGKRVLVGQAASGARRVAMQMLLANGISEANARLLDGELGDDASALANGTADGAILILPPESDRVQRLLRVENIRLMDFSPEAAAYTSRFPALTSVVMYRASVEFAPPIPSADITLLATSTSLVVRRDLHPSLVALLTHAVIQNPKTSFDKAGDPVLFYKAGQFPTADDPEFEVANEARAIYKSGELPILLRAMAPAIDKAGLPFALTAFVGTYGVPLVLALIPALTILLPLARFAPSIYRWSVRQRLLRWYGALRALERRLDHVSARPDPAALAAEIDRIDSAVRGIRVPLEFSDQHYELRTNIELVRRRLRALVATTG